MRVKGQNSVERKSILQFGKPEERSILDLFPYKSCTEEGVLITRRSFSTLLSCSFYRRGRIK